VCIAKIFLNMPKRSRCGNVDIPNSYEDEEDLQPQKRSAIDLDETEDTAGAATEVEDAVVTAMRIPLITDEIFRYLSVSELLKCGLVNKQWQLTSRTYLRTTRKCLVRVPSLNACKSLTQLNQVIQNCECVPYNGFALKNIDPKENHNCLGQTDCIKNSVKVMTSILSGLHVKYLNLTFDAYFGRHNDPVIRFVGQIFQHQACNIQGISLQQIPHFMIKVSRSFGVNTSVKKHWLPKLSELDVPADVDFARRNSYIVRELIDSSPQLSTTMVY